MKDFRTLKVWEKAHELTIKVYKITSYFPKEEMFGLTSQFRRAATSIGLNIAEGCGRGSDADFKRFLQIAFGSISECQYCIILAKDLNYIMSEPADKIYNEFDELMKMLATLINKLKKC